MRTRIFVLGALVAFSLGLAVVAAPVEAGKCHKHPEKCQPSPTPTPTEEPTPTPTEPAGDPTSTPTVEPTPEPTATPNATATAAADEPHDSCLDVTPKCDDVTPNPAPESTPPATIAPPVSVTPAPALGPAPIVTPEPFVGPTRTPTVPTVQLPPSGVLPGAPESGSAGLKAESLEADGQAVFKGIYMCQLVDGYRAYYVCKIGGWLN